ncbi:hypothetical protein EDB19DRAFT_1824799 [Suillus lakei]|nr:hypothetical protein EDB19DRAFT_1824799 [Suillus lakei]
MWLKITSSTSRVFEEETAGFQEHLAELLVDFDPDSGVTMFEKAGFRPINEYDNDNPDLIPGTYPTLFSFGIGGFEDDAQPKALSSQKQAQYYLNIADDRPLDLNQVALRLGPRNPRAQRASITRPTHNKTRLTTLHTYNNGSGTRPSGQ